MDTLDTDFRQLTRLMAENNIEEAVRLSGIMLASVNENWTEHHNTGHDDPTALNDLAHVAMAHVQALQLANLHTDAFTTAVMSLWQMSLDSRFGTSREIDVPVIAILNSAITSLMGSLPILISNPDANDRAHADAILTYLSSMLFARYQFAKTTDVEPVKLAYTILKDMKQYNMIKSPTLTLPVDGKVKTVPADDVAAIMPDLTGRAIAHGFAFE